MKRVFGLTILVAGIILLVFGINATHSLNEKVVEAVKGTYTDETMWYIIGGVVLILVGGGLFLFRRRGR